uniref:Protein AATF n=1 Tax=Anopheles farauti TaxID=69004 RepID=A0A182QZA0_9DIPT
MKKKPATLSDKLNKLFAPEEHSEESGDETAPKFSEFDETPNETAKNAALSEFRKRNIKFLEEFDRKYKGAVSSRSETFDDDDDNDEEDDGDGDFSDDEDEDDFGGDEDEDDDDSESEDVRPKKGKSKSLVLLKPPQSDDDSEESGEDYEDDDESDDVSGDDEVESFRPYKKEGKQTSDQQMTLVKEENRQDTINKGLAVQNQLKIWERLLEMRIKVQPCLIASNSLPPALMCEKLAAKSDEFRQKAAQAAKTVSETMDGLLELQEFLLGRFAETKDLLKSGSKRKAPTDKHLKSKRPTLEGYDQMLASRCKDMENYRNNVLMKWHDRTSIASKGRGNQHQSLSVLKKIEDSLISRDEMVRKTQLYRGGYKLLSRPVQPKDPNDHDEEQDQDTTEQQQVARSVYDGEIFDDSDFYHQLLRELIEYKTSTTDSPQEISNKLAELQRLRNKMKKKVDTKASKGRKIRYVVHNKLVNYMAPVPDYDWTDEAKDELFGSLFGQTPATEER